MTSGARGGAEYAAVRLLDALAARGHETVLLTSHPDIADGHARRRPPRRAGPKARLAHLAAARLDLAGRAAPAAPRAGSARPPSTCSCSTSRRSSCWLPRLPPALRERVAWAEWGPVPEPLRSGLPSRLYSSAARDVAVVLAISEGTRESLVESGVPADRVAVVPNAIDPARYRPQPELGAACRAELGIPPDAFVIGCLTRFNPKKRNEVAIDAAVALARQPGPPVHLLMIGEGETESELRTRAAALAGAAHFVPSTGVEPAELLSGCDVVVFCPSPTEGEPLAISMGMLVERPVVATAAEGATGMIQPGTGAIATPDHDPSAVAMLLAGYRSDPERARTEGRAARELAAARHDPAVVAERAEALLRP